MLLSVHLLAAAPGERMDHRVAEAAVDHDGAAVAEESRAKTGRQEREKEGGELTVRLGQIVPRHLCRRAIRNLEVNWFNLPLKSVTPTVAAPLPRQGAARVIATIGNAWERSASRGSRIVFIRLCKMIPA